MTHDDPGEPTTPLPPEADQWPGQPAGSPTGQQYPYPPPYQTPYQSSGGYYAQQPPQPPTSYPPVQPPFPGDPAPAGERAKVPGWMWPVVAGMALVLGLGGGALGGALVASSDSRGTGEVLRVERRTAPPLPADNGSIAAVAAKVLPSTVQIVAEYAGKDHGATGSGFVIDGQGHVITNNHVVAQADADNGPIEIIDQQGKHSKATVVGRSTVYDIAVLKVDAARKLTPAAIGSADQMRVGETVVAIGSPLGLSATVTSGIISAVHRPVTTGEGQNDNSYINAVQTDAAINPGNSGGPLVNLQGEVVGVNSAIASLGSQVASDQGGNIGVGFAIPIEQVQVTTSQILKTGKAQYPVMGANVRGTAKLDGATVESITAGLPAADADLKVGDVIRKVDGKPVTGSIDLVVAIRSHVPGEKVTLTIERGGKTLDVLVGLDAKTG
ncbi:MAG: peptidase and chymotrypsin/Hap [Marmoricola sp.]|nr:peptidase and chymotrypsin/Hap [Marmoricola sp.]